MTLCVGDSSQHSKEVFAISGMASFHAIFIIDNKNDDDDSDECTSEQVVVDGNDDGDDDNDDSDDDMMMMIVMMILLSSSSSLSSSLSSSSSLLLLLLPIHRSSPTFLQGTMQKKIMLVFLSIHVISNMQITYGLDCCC